MIFDYYTKNINIEKLIHFSKLKSLKILDFGCGKGIWNKENLSNKKIKKIILFDKEKKLKLFLKKKYTNKKIEVNFKLNKIIKKNNYNLVIFYSVIQYIGKKNLFKLIKKLSLKKTFIITDIPFFPRIIEFLILPILNFKRFLFVLKIIFSKNYKKLNFYYFRKTDFKELDKYFFITFRSNLHDLKFLRYTVILEPKN